jgi:hypothetical protein
MKALATFIAAVIFFSVAFTDIEKKERLDKFQKGKEHAHENREERRRRKKKRA